MLRMGGCGAHAMGRHSRERRVDYGSYAEESEQTRCIVPTLRLGNLIAGIFKLPVTSRKIEVDQ